jgi:hypothetical protein
MLLFKRPARQRTAIAFRQWRHRCSKGLKLTLAANLLFCAPFVLADIDREHSLKAGFIYNFSRFSEWSLRLEGKPYFTICSPDRAFIKASSYVLVGKKVHGATVKSIKVKADYSDTYGCDVLFITKPFFVHWKHHLPKPVLKSTMLIGETQGFIESGGQINFFLIAGKIRFEVNPSLLERAGINMSSKVLRLGKVHGRSAP